MPANISQQVAAFLEKNPEATNQDLYVHLPEARKGTIRHCKSKLMKTSSGEVTSSKGTTKKATLIKKSPVKAKEAANKSAKSVAKKKAKTKEPSPFTAIEERVSAIEGQIQLILDSLQGKGETDNTALETIKTFSEVDGKGKDLENNLLGFIKDKKGKITNELHYLEDLQQTVTSKISAFVRTLKRK